MTRTFLEDNKKMTDRDLMINALELKPPVKGTLVPHFELVFFLTQEAIGRVHPTHRIYANKSEVWDSMTNEEKQLTREDMVSVQYESAKKYKQNGIMLSGCPWSEPEELLKQGEIYREKYGNEHFLAVSLDPTYAIPSGNDLESFVYRLVDEPEKVHADAETALSINIRRIDEIAKRGDIDGVCMCSDYCFNTNPFLSVSMMDEFVFPYLSRFIEACKDRGLYTIKHTDGNIMPILDRLVSCKPNALHSLDPQAKVDIAEVKKRVGKKVCLIGNVNCGLLQTGTDEEVIESATYALSSGMAGGGYIYATSNTVYTGMKLSRYELMQKIRNEKGWY